MKTEDPEGAGGYATDQYDSIIVEVSKQDPKQTPTTSSLVLINMLASRMDAVDVFMPAVLHMLRNLSFILCACNSCLRNFLTICRSI